MNKPLFIVIVVGLLAAGIAAAWLAHREGLRKGIEIGREQGTYYSRQMPVDTGTVSRTGNVLHFGAAHAEHDLGDEDLAEAAEALLTTGGGLVELHEPRFGLRNALHDSLRLTTLTGPAQDLVLRGLASLNTSVVNGRPRVTITNAAGDSVQLDFSDASEVTTLQGKVNGLFLVTPQGSQHARLDFVLTTGQPPAPPHRWAMITLTLLQDSTTSDFCVDHYPPPSAPAPAPPAP